MNAGRYVKIKDGEKERIAKALSGFAGVKIPIEDIYVLNTSHNTIYVGEYMIAGEYKGCVVGRKDGDHISNLRYSF